jgi:HSP20 family protein
MSLIRYEPGFLLDDWFETDRFFNRGLLKDTEKDFFVPKVNVAETDSDYLLTAEVPGIKEGDIDLEINDGTLTLKGHSKEEKNSDEPTFRVREISERKFEKSFRLGEEVDAGNISARLEDGMLRVTLPKKEEVKPKKVKIQINS